MSEFKIEKGVPLPDQSSRGGRRGKYPWAELEVGDSFFVPGKTARQLGGANTGGRRAFPDRRFVSRTVEGGTRIWRVE